MKKAQVTEALNGGFPLMVAEYLMSKPERIEYRDKTTKQPATMDKLSHSVMTEQGVLTVEQDTRKIRDFDPAKYVSPFKRGQRLCILISSLQVQLGVITVRGTPHVIED